MGDLDGQLSYNFRGGPGRFGSSAVGQQSAATMTAVDHAPSSTSSMIMKLLVDIVKTTSRLESSGTLLENNLDFHVADPTNRLEAGLKLHREETDEQIEVLKLQLLDMRAKNQTHQANFMNKLAVVSRPQENPEEDFCEILNPSQPRPFDQSATSLGSFGEKFVPRRLFIKGFCNYGCEEIEGISESLARSLASTLLSHLKLEFRGFLSDVHGGISAPRLRNSQITLFVRSDVQDDAAWLILKDLKSVLAKSPLLINGNPIFLQLDSEPWKKRRRAGLAKASLVFEEFLADTSGVDIIKDWPSGTLWANKLDVVLKLGHWDRNRGWMWHEKSVMKLIPEVEVSALSRGP
jgi:hypothetical protein